jgi:hypothetical protein
MTAANTLQKTYVQTLQASFATGTLPAHVEFEIARCIFSFLTLCAMPVYRRQAPCPLPKSIYL